MFEFFWKKGAFEWGISEALSMATLLAVAYGVIYKYGYFSGLGIPWYIYSLSVNYIILSTLHFFIVFLLGLFLGQCAKQNKTIFILTAVTIGFYLSLFLVSTLATMTGMMDEFSINVDNKLEVFLHHINNMYILFPNYTFMLIWGSVLCFYAENFSKSKISLALVLGLSVCCISFLGTSHAKHDFWQAEQVFNAVILQPEQSKDNELYFLLDANDQTALVLAKEDMAKYSHSEMRFRFINTTDIERIVYPIKQ